MVSRSIQLTYDELLVRFLTNLDSSLGLHLFKDVEITDLAARWSWDQAIVDTFGLSCSCCQSAFTNDRLGLLW